MRASLSGAFALFVSLMRQADALPVGGLDLPRELIMDVNKAYVFASLSEARASTHCLLAPQAIPRGERHCR